jgi:hypothetical protein
VILNLKLETTNFNLCFARQCLNLWNPFVIDIRPEQLSTSQVHIYQYYYSFIKRTWIYSCDFERNALHTANCNVHFTWQVTKIVKSIHRCYKTRAIFEMQSPNISVFSLLSLKVTCIYSCNFESKNRNSEL